MDLSREQFLKELNALKEKLFNVESEDSGAIYFALYMCKIEIDLEEGSEGEITIYKPYTDMNITIDFAVLNSITKENKDYRLEFNNGMSDVIIHVVA